MNKIIILVLMLFAYFSEAQSLPSTQKYHKTIHSLKQCGQFSITLPTDIELKNTQYFDYPALFIIRKNRFGEEINDLLNQFDSENVLDSVSLSLSCHPKSEEEKLLWPYQETIIEDDSNPRGIETWTLKDIRDIQAANSHGKIAIIEHSGIQMWTTDFQFCLPSHNTNHNLCGSGSINNVRQTESEDHYQQKIIQLLHLTVINWVKSIQFFPVSN